MTGTDLDVEKVSLFGTDCIHLGFHLADHIAATVVTRLPSSVYAIVTDTTIAALCLEPVVDAFRAALPEGGTSRLLTYAIEPGEQSKSRAGKADVEDFLLSQRCTRDLVIVAVGGGVVGDLTGFVAATFMRGVRFVQVPTTLLAMVDSAVGGKTAIDVPLGKNLIGAFHQPEYIFIDPALLETLPAREFENGMAEIIKTAAIWDADDFEKLESQADAIRSAVVGPSTAASKAGRCRATRSDAQSLLLDVIKGSIAVKAHIVTIDEKETGLRNLVNFGHTIGHALEAVLTPHILHGECVAIGMVIEAEISRALGTLSNAAVGRLIRCLAAHGLPVSVNDPRIARSPNANDLRIERLLDVMRVDKKNAGPVKKIVLLSRIGKTVEERASGVADAVIARALAPALRLESIRESQPAHSFTVRTPGSKSISNRVLILAALATGTCRISNVLHSDDTKVMLDALRAMDGATFSWENDSEILVVRGGGGRLRAPAGGKPVYLGNAGTAARFLTAVTTLTQGTERTTLTGNARMKQRPIAPLVEALATNGCDIVSTEAAGCIPLSIGPTGLRGGRISLAASISSQYVSAILLAAPYAKTPVELELVGGEVISQLYIDMTIALMATFGVTVERLDARRYRIPKATYTSPATFAVESDASSATYPLAVAAMTGTTCTIPNIGTASLQGDARFAKEVLEPMGCRVQQTGMTTTVTGPPVGALHAIPEVDMEPMTDAFMTATVLAAVANKGGTTRIRGIANQRVKECNRIEAMRTQLAKFGVTVRELPDGIEVDGISPESLGSHQPQRRSVAHPGQSNGFPPHDQANDICVHCYDDHRIAMAFSVLATVPGGASMIINDRRCVEKTWPSWWDDLSRSFGGLSIEGVEKVSESGMARPHRYPLRASIVLIGMRGAGKTYTGSIGASILRRRLIDADIYFGQREGIDVRDFVHQHGWAEFRQRELIHCKELLSAYAEDHVIALGGGIVETPEACALIRQFAASSGPVVNVTRNLDEIIAYLDAESSRPSLGEPLQAIAARRAPLYRLCSNYDLQGSAVPERLTSPNVSGNQDLPKSATASRENIGRFFRFITGADLNRPDITHTPLRTYFLPLTFPDVLPALSLLNEVSVGVDALELRIDLLSPDGKVPVAPHVPPVNYVAAQLAALRRNTQLPIIYTVRTASQGGTFPDDAEGRYFELVAQGVRWGCEYVDLQIGLDSEHSQRLVESKMSTLIIASYHDWSGSVKWDSRQMSAIYSQCAALGDVVKIVCKANSMSDNLDMMTFRKSVPKGKPLITLNMGTQGQMSRILNPTLSPVTHPGLAPSAPGQLSFRMTMSALHLLGQLPSRRFFLFGSPIAHSKSPIIHNMAFEQLGLPYRYELFEAKAAEAGVEAILRSSDFGGASVTIPLKLDIIPLLDEITDDAKLIGAVNTVSVRQSEHGTSSLIGTNTDWRGLHALLTGAISTDHAVTDRSCGLVIGAGGTARAALFALHAFGLKRLYVFNRTAANAETLVRDFPSEYGIRAITTLDPSTFGAELPAAIISTVPGSATTLLEGQDPSAVIFLPASLLGRPEGGVVIDAAYKPRRTPLIQLAESRISHGWHAVPGIFLLLEQAYHQSELWTGRRIARRLIEHRVLEEYERENTG